MNGVFVVLVALASFVLLVRVMNAMTANRGSSWTRRRGDAPDVAPVPRVKKKRTKKRAPPPLDQLTKPRARHYAFAHERLRSVSLRSLEVWRGLPPDEREHSVDEALAEMWGSIDELPGEDSGRAPTSKTLEDGLLVRMPEPRGLTECQWVFLVPREDGVRFFTLEKSLFASTLCEWTGDLHLNCGPCPPDEETFLATVRSKLATPT